MKWKKRIIDTNKTYVFGVPRLYFDNKGIPYVGVNAYDKVDIFWAQNKKGLNWQNKSIMKDYSINIYSGYFDNENKFHFFIAPSNDKSRSRYGYFEFVKSGEDWSRELKNEAEKISIGSRFAVTKDKSGNVHQTYIIVKNKKHKVVYEKIAAK